MHAAWAVASRISLRSGYPSTAANSPAHASSMKISARAAAAAAFNGAIPASSNTSQSSQTLVSSTSRSGIGVRALWRGGFAREPGMLNLVHDQVRRRFDQHDGNPEYRRGVEC